MFAAKQQPADFDFICPKIWTDGATENLKCIVPKSKFNDESCDIFADTVSFKITPVGGSKSTACAVINIYTVCDGTLNSDQCGCRKNGSTGSSIVIDYNITAVKADHEGALWECQPQCLNSFGLPEVLSPPNSTACFSASFGEYKAIFHLDNCSDSFHENRKHRYR